MKIINYTVCLVFGFFMLACGTTEKQELETDGMLYSSNNAMYFVPCEARDKVLTVIDKKGELDSLYKQTLGFYYLGEPVYAKLKGKVNESAKKVLQFDDFHEAFFEVDQAIALTKRTQVSADCCNCDYKGENEKWEFEISEIDGTISFRDNEKRQSLLFDYQEPVEINNCLQYKVKDVHTQKTMSIVINPVSIKNELGQKQYPINIVLDSVEYNGLASKCFNEE